MTEHPTAGVGAPEQPTTQIPPQTASAADQQEGVEPQAEPGGSGAEAPTRAFAGFRTERRVPGAELAVIPGAAHGLFGDRPDETIGVLRGWLSRHDAA